MITVEEARRHYPPGDAAHDFDHVLRVLALAEHIGQAEGGEMDVVRAAALLHDVGRAEERASGGCHAAIGARRAREILAGHPPEKVEAVAQAIAAHRFRERTRPPSLEAKVLYDADKLDCIGAIGVARAYAVAGQCDQRLWTPVPPDADLHRHNLTAEHSPVIEFALKLSQVRDTLFTATARRIAEERHRYMVGFFEQLEQEVRGEA